MAESKNKQKSEGSDNYGQAAKQTANAAKEMGKKTAQQAAAKGAEATGRAAVATVKAGAQVGKAVANIAAGTAAGGPWGAIIAAAWSLRHTLFKILVCICLIVVFLIVIVVSWPSIVFDKLMDDLFGSSDKSGYETTLHAAYYELTDGIYNAIDKGYQFALDEVDQIITDGDYDYDLSIAAVDDLAGNNKYYDTCYILAAYSASVKQNKSSQEQMISKLENVKADMFPVTYEEKTLQRPKEDEPSETETVKYVACVIHSFNEKIVLKAFDLDLDAEYENYNITYGEYIEYMSKVLKMTLFNNTE